MHVVLGYIEMRPQRMSEEFMKLVLADRDVGDGQQERGMVVSRMCAKGRVSFNHNPLSD